MNLHATIKVPQHVVSRKVAQELVILDVKSGKYFGLDPVGARFWEILLAGDTFGRAVEQMNAEFDVDQQRLSSDMEKLLSDLQGAGLIVVTD